MSHKINLMNHLQGYVLKLSIYFAMKCLTLGICRKEWRTGLKGGGGGEWSSDVLLNYAKEFQEKQGDG